jgi:phage shock protein A
MAQQTILGRITQLLRANVNAALDAAEDPEKMLDQMIRDFTNNIAEAEEAVAQTIGNLRLMEADAAESRETATEWGAKARAASARADSLRGSGNTTEADRFDALARQALKMQIQLEEQVRSFDPQISAQTEVVDKLKAGLNGMRAKREELVTKRDELVARAKMARATSQVHDAVKSVDIMDPTSEIARFEERIRREEARGLGMAEVAASSMDAQFRELEDLAGDSEVEARLAALKSSGG